MTETDTFKLGSDGKTLTDNAKQVLVRRLIREGLLRVVDGQ